MIHDTTLTSETVDAIEALCEEHRRMDCLGAVLPVATVEVLVSAYRTAQRIRRLGLYALNGHALDLVRELLEQLPEGGTGPLWEE